ncbi:MAG: phosphatidylinositol 4-kinase [Amphiamblys sp. WSBS2006]|nr:MAG: phosphatidylinositol 4-kinase [Amphiamblys sp. WSBS2006]
MKQLFLEYTDTLVETKKTDTDSVLVMLKHCPFAKNIRKATLLEDAVDGLCAYIEKTAEYPPDSPCSLKQLEALYALSHFLKQDTDEARLIEKYIQSFFKNILRVSFSAFDDKRDSSRKEILSCVFEVLFVHGKEKAKNTKLVFDVLAEILNTCTEDEGKHITQLDGIVDGLLRVGRRSPFLLDGCAALFRFSVESLGTVMTHFTFFQDEAQQKNLVSILGRLFDVFEQIFDEHYPVHGFEGCLDTLEKFMTSMQGVVLSAVSRNDYTCHLYASVLQIVFLIDAKHTKSEIVVETCFYIYQNEKIFGGSENTEIVFRAASHAIVRIFSEIKEQKKEILFLLQKKTVFASVQEGGRNTAVFLVLCVGECLKGLVEKGELKEAEEFVAKTVTDVLIRSQAPNATRKNNSVGKMFVYLSEIACRTKSAQLVRQVLNLLSNYQDTIEERECYFAALNTLAQNEDVGVYCEIVEILSRHVLARQTEETVCVVMEALEGLLRVSQHEERKTSELLHMVLECFIERCSSLSETKTPELQQRLCVFLVALVAKTIPGMVLSERTARTLLYFWFALTRETNPKRAALKTSHRDLSVIALNTPPLLAQSKFVLDSFHVLDQKYRHKDETTALVKAIFFEILPELANEIKSIDFPRAMFLLVLHTVYKARVDQNNFDGLFSILANQAVFRVGIFRTVDGIVYRLVTDWAERNGSEKETTQIIEGAITFICNRQKHIENSGLKIFSYFVGRPEFQFNKDVLEKLLNTIQKLSEITMTGQDEETVMFGENPELIDSKMKQDETLLLVRGLSSMAEETLEKMTAASPDSVLCFIMVRLCQQRTSSCFYHRLDNELALKHLTKYKNTVPRIDEYAHLFASTEDPPQKELAELLASEEILQKDIRPMIDALYRKETPIEYLRDVCVLALTAGCTKTVSCLCTALSSVFLENKTAVLSGLSLALQKTKTGPSIFSQCHETKNPFRSTFTYGPCETVCSNERGMSSTIFMDFLYQKIGAETFSEEAPAVLYSEILSTLFQTHIPVSVPSLILLHAAFLFLAKQRQASLLAHFQQTCLSYACAVLLNFPKANLCPKSSLRKTTHLKKLHAVIEEIDIGKEIAESLLYAISSELNFELTFTNRIEKNTPHTQQLTEECLSTIAAVSLPSALALVARLEISPVPARVLLEGRAVRWTALSMEGFIKNALDLTEDEILFGEFVSPTLALRLLQHPPKQKKFLAYALGSLCCVSQQELCFFVPQLVQSLRYDTSGWVESFLVTVSQSLPLFAHQVIWHIKASLYVDAETAKTRDPLFDTFSSLVAKIETGFSPELFSFYRREMNFFETVTRISATVAPLVRRSKEEKKQKINEELRKIEVEKGVYLPTNPLNTVVGIDYSSGRPLQSHAKTPFMAHFSVLRNGETHRQAVIFKFGDDCRQDMLSLQLIAVFKEIFSAHGLPLYLYPYRVVSTSAGSGVIEVIPNSLSRDQIGREKINSLYEYFVLKFGDESSSSFASARGCFIRSLAAYSVVSYFLSVRDRHNGNIMLDDAGHIIHIDFGYILSIAPGGISFENPNFKLTSEMIHVMGGKNNNHFFDLFQEYCIKAFLVCRLHRKELCFLLEQMADCGLPCFKGTTLKKFKAKFAAEIDDRGARKYFANIVYGATESMRTLIYDIYQHRQSGTPY